MFIFSFDKIESNPNFGEPKTTRIGLLLKESWIFENPLSEGLKYFECLDVRMMFDIGNFSTIFFNVSVLI